MIKIIIIENSKMWYGETAEIKALYKSMVRSGNYYPLYQDVKFSTKNQHAGICTESIGDNDKEDYLRVVSSDTVLALLIK